MLSLLPYLVLFILLVIIVIIFWLIFDDKYTNEKFGDPVSVKKTPDILDISKQFEDLIVYDNQPDGTLGLEKCYEGCKGYCVEYGLTGSAYCYPVHPPEQKDFDGSIVPNDQKLSYPNLR